MSMTSGPLFLSMVSFSFICLLWGTLVNYYQISEAVFPGPVTVFGSFWHLLVDGSLFKHTVASPVRAVDSGVNAPRSKSSCIIG